MMIFGRSRSDERSGHSANPEPCSTVSAAPRGAEIIVPTDFNELTVGLLGAKIDRRRAASGIDGGYVADVRLLEIERRILALEASANEARRLA